VYQRELSQSMDQEALQTMLDYGVTYCEVDAAVLAEIQEKTAFLLEEYCPAELLAAIQAK